MSQITKLNKKEIHYMFWCQSLISTKLFSISNLPHKAYIQPSRVILVIRSFHLSYPISWIWIPEIWSTLLGIYSI